MASTHAQRKALGDHGERLAASHLRARGFIVLDRNWRCREGEIDIVAEDRGTLVVCEVKTRSSARYGTPFEAITPEKAARLRRLGWLWSMEQQTRFGRLRLDVVAIVWHRSGRAEVEHIVGVV